MKLIEADLYHVRLISILNAGHLDADDYLTDLDDTIFRNLRISRSDKRIEEIRAAYQELARQVKKIDAVKDRKAVRDLALQIYMYLKSVSHLGWQKDINDFRFYANGNPTKSHQKAMRENSEVGSKSQGE